MKKTEFQGEVLLELDRINRKLRHLCKHLGVDEFDEFEEDDYLYTAQSVTANWKHVFDEDQEEAP